MNLLPIAQRFNSFIRYADVVKMVNFTVFSGLLSNDSKNGNFKSPLFYTFKLFSNNCLGLSVDAYVSCDTFGITQYRSIPYLDITAVYAKEKSAVFVNVVNCHQDKRSALISFLLYLILLAKLISM